MAMLAARRPSPESRFASVGESEPLDIPAARGIAPDATGTYALLLGYVVSTMRAHADELWPGKHEQLGDV